MPEQKSRRAVWEEFCKRKAFKPSLCTRICSLHFAEESYGPSHSPQFLESIGYTEKTSCVKPNVYQRLTSLRPVLAFLTYLHRHNRREQGDKPRGDNVKRYQYLKDTFTDSFNKFCFFNVLIFLHCFTI
ncbi:---NA--- [Paramuricea clavata]|uniref:---NA n=1 Tax=Paramuricea clavata TaxID=317549 RepID=A0A7D9E3S3_PARCT|nr:---NA--- [Paramuricea clavata]